MKDVQIDVHLEVPRGELLDDVVSTETRDKLAADIVERLRDHADQVVRRVGGQLRTDRQPEFYLRRGSHFTEGGDWLLVASRWWVTVPNWFDPKTMANRTTVL
jgi:hypothetical protein